MKTITLTPRTERWPKGQEWKITSIRIPIDVARGIELRSKAADCRSPSDAIIQILAQYVEGTETPRKSAKVFLEWALKPDKSARKDYSEKAKAKANGKNKPKAAKKVKAKAARKTKAAKPTADQPQLPGTANGAEAPAVQGEPGTVTSGTQPAPEAQAQPEAPATSEGQAEAQPSQEAQPEAANEPHQDAEPRAAAPSNLGPDGEQMAF
jgi:hypothetical protein